MEKHNISLSYGIHRTPSIGHDGELSECVNLVPRNGELVNIAPPSAKGLTLPAGAVLQCVHHINADQADNYISYNSANGRLYWQRIGGGTPNDPFATLTGVTQILTIGNSLITLGNDVTNFFLWKGSNYINLGSRMPALTLQFGLQTQKVETQANYIPSGNNLLPSYLEFAELSPEHPNRAIGNTTVQKELSELAHGLRNEMIANIHKENKFALPFFVRYAFRLFDGSLAQWSPTVLMVPNTLPPVSIKSINNLGPSDASLYNKYPRNCDVYCAMDKGLLDYAMVLASGETNPLLLWKDIIQSVEIFVSAPIYLYRPDLDATYINYGDTVNVQNVVEDYYKRYYHVPEIRISKENTDTYYQYAENKYIPILTTDYIYDPTDTPISTYNIQAFIGLPGKSLNGLIASVTEESVFYKLASIAVDNLSSARTAVPIRSNVVSTITSQETVDNMSSNADYYTFSNGFSYNSRAFLFGARHYKGIARWSPAAFIPYTDKLNSGNAGGLNLAFKIESISRDDILGSNQLATTDIDTPAFCWIYAPDSEAKVFYSKWHGQTPYANLYGEIDLIQHKLLSGAYWFNLFDNPVTSLTASNYPAYSQEPTSEPNRLFISDALNPFLIRETNTVTLDVAAIIAVCTTTQALSQGQFGQFPLYAFTTDGVWALEVSTEGRVSARQPVSRDVITQGTQPLQIDDAVVFICAQGLKLLAGKESKLISEFVEGHNPDDTQYRVNRDDYTDFNSLLAANDTSDFVVQLQSAKLLYDYAQQLIHVYIPGISKHYVYALDTAEWSTQYLEVGNLSQALSDAALAALPADATEQQIAEARAKARAVPAGFPSGTLLATPLGMPTATVPAYPLSLVQYGNDAYLYQRQKSSSILRPGVALTRPLAFDDPTAMKALMDFRIIGQKTNQGTFRRMAVYVSNDGYQWRQLPSLKRGSFKYFRFLLLSRMTDFDTLTGVTTLYQPRRLNRLR